MRYPEGKIHEDEFTTYKVLFAYEKIAVIEQPLYAYFQNSQSIMGSQWNPNHIAETEGMLAALKFFTANGFHDAEMYAARAYIYSIYRNLQNAKTYKEQYSLEVASLKRLLKVALLKYGKLADMDIHNNNWLYYEAYPNLTIPYRASRKLIGKLKREKG